jgi:hypothetical protein
LIEPETGLTAGGQWLCRGKKSGGLLLGGIREENAGEENDYAEPTPSSAKPPEPQIFLLPSSTIHRFGE